MGDMGEVFNVQREATKNHRARMLEQANVDGWDKHTDWHYSRMFAGNRMDWWPSGGKARYAGKMIYGHVNVNALIKRLKEAEPS